MGWCQGGYHWQGCHGYMVHSAAVLGSISLLGTSPPCAPLLLILIQRINTTNNLPNWVFPLQKNNNYLLLPPTRSSHISKTSIWHLNNTYFKPAYYTSLKNDNSSEYIYIILLTFFPKYFLLSEANPRTVIRQEPILERYSTLSATTKPTVKKIFDAGRNGTARIASPMVKILKKRRLSLLSNTACNKLQIMQCSSCTCVIKHRKLMLPWLYYLKLVWSCL